MKSLDRFLHPGGHIFYRAETKRIRNKKWKIHRLLFMALHFLVVVGEETRVTVSAMNIGLVLQPQFENQLTSYRGHAVFCSIKLKCPLF